ncbi:MAG: hypothetical protein NTY33_03055 [Candidatus Moranbacteria bacterium]|nr:hypothetical protein [Candidatus Moranbacteria bacterium]
MVNINLVTDGRSQKTVGSGISSLFVALLVVLIVYATLFFYGKNLESKAAELKAAYDAKRNSLIIGDSKKILDFQDRLIVARESMTEERSAKQDLDKVEAAVVAGTRLNGYSYDETTKAITLDCYADNYDTVAKQILSFKSSDYFISVMAGGTKFDSKSGKINFPVILTLLR